MLRKNNEYKKGAYMKVYIILIIKTILLLTLFNNNAHSQGAVIQVKSGDPATITASLATSGSITAPVVYRWYREPTGGTSFQTGTTLTTTPLTSDTAFYVSVSGGNYCESPRLMVSVMMERAVTVTVCTGEAATLTASLAVAGMINNPQYKWYATPTSTTVLGTSPTFTTSTALTSDTVFYVSVEGSDYCQSLRLAVNVKVDACTADVIVCIGEKATMTASLETPGSIANPVYKWYAAPTGGSSLHTGPEFTTATGITTDTAFYVSVSGNGLCESPRKRVIVEVESCTELFADKNATLNTIAQNGEYANPVSILGNEVVSYEISTVNPTLANVEIVIVDTLPAYLEHVGTATAVPAATSITPSNTSAPPYPARRILTWKFQNVAPDAEVKVSFDARPLSGSVASQPLFINRAMVSIVKSPSDSIHLQSNGTFHQGAGISITTFSASFGGEIFNAAEQALDYMSTPSSGVIIVPDEGYAFAGWSHGDYSSLRGATVAAQDGIMHYDTLTVYGNVELHANFVPVEASLYDEQEDVELKVSEVEDKVWAVKDELYMQISKAGSVVKIHTLDGTLFNIHTIVSPGLSKIKMPRGIYIIAISNKIGQKVRIE